MLLLVLLPLLLSLFLRRVQFLSHLLLLMVLQLVLLLLLFALLLLRGPTHQDGL